MTQDTRVVVINELCARMKDMLLTATQEEASDFFFINTTVDLLEAFRVRGIELDVQIFSDSYMKFLYNEIHSYLLKSK